MNPYSPIVLQGQNILDPKPEKDFARKKNYTAISLMNIYEKKILNIASQI